MSKQRVLKLEGLLERWKMQGREEKLMSPERWRRLEQLYCAALRLPPNERRAFLARNCADDEELRREAESLLRADEVKNELLQSDAFVLGMRVLAGENKMSTQETTQRFETRFAEERTIDNRYVILEGLDAGGMGEVFKARDLKFPDRLVVIKVLKKESQSHPWIFKKFRGEGEAQSRVQHPNVAMVFDKGVLPGGEDYLVVEFVNGQNLGQVITDHKTEDHEMDGHFAAEVIRQICSGVAAIHRSKLIHRDLKPKNIMVFETSETDDVPVRVKIIDFGIVRDLNKSTVYGQSVGTLHYMSPEQVRGDEVSTASDVYSVGVIAYQMLTNNLPFNAKTYTQLDALQIAGVKVKPSSLRHGLSQEADRVILKALSYDARERYQSAKEFSVELVRALIGETPPSTSADEPAPIIPSNNPPKGAGKKWLVIASGVILAAALLGVVWWLSQSGQPSTRVEAITTALESNKSSIEGKGYDKDATYPMGQPPQDMVYATVGFNIWRTRPASTRDVGDAARETVEGEETVSERVDEGGYVAVGEGFRLGIESLTENFLPNNDGYLYVINREQYADGSFGRAWLLFPNAKTFDGNNIIKTGEPIELPKSAEPYRVRRSTDRSDQVAETYSIIISPWKFWLPPLGEKRTELPPELFADWERQFSARSHRASLRGGAGKARTKREQRVGTRETVEADEPLTSSDPLPQTVLRTVVRKGAPAMVTVALRIRD